MFVVLLAVAAALVLVVALIVVLAVRRRHRPSALMAVSAADGLAQPVYGITPPSASAVVSEPVLASVGAAAADVGFAPRPAPATLPSLPPAVAHHRPVSAGTSVGAPRTAGVRGGAHRRDSDADEIARLRGLHEAGKLSDAEFSTLAGRLG